MTIDPRQNKMIEAGLGMLARFIPPEVYTKMVDAINGLAQVAAGFDRRLAEVQALALVVQQQQVRLDFLESIVRDNLDGAGAAFAERDQWMVPGRIEKALAPAQDGALQNDN